VQFATYNIHRAVGSDRRRDPARVGQVIATLDADVVGLQEVDWFHDAPSARSPFEVLHDLPGYTAIAGRNLRDHRGNYGNLLLTRFTVLEVRRFDITHLHYEPRGVIDVDLDTPAGRLRVLVTHLGLLKRERRKQVARIAKEIDPDRPTVMLGDFNEWRQTAPSLRPLVARPEPSPSSFPAWFPMLPLDRILPLSPDVTVTGLRAHRSPLSRLASDHLPVTGEITYTNRHKS
jgi:endonuclease/exonuclease/phosphatase family metal-dependent hydrolase